MMLDTIGRSCQAKSAQCLPHLCFGVLLGSNDRAEISSRCCSSKFSDTRGSLLWIGFR